MALNQGAVAMAGVLRAVNNFSLKEDTIEMANFVVECLTNMEELIATDSANILKMLREKKLLNYMHPYLKSEQVLLVEKVIGFIRILIETKEMAVQRHLIKSTIFGRIMKMFSSQLSPTLKRSVDRIFIAIASSKSNLLFTHISRKHRNLLRSNDSVIAQLKQEFARNPGVNPPQQPIHRSTKLRKNIPVTYQPRTRDILPRSCK